MKHLFILFALVSLALAACKSRQKTTMETQALPTSETSSSSLDSIPDIPEGSTLGSEKLFSDKWILYEADGVTLMPSINSQPAFLQFYPGQISRISGSTGCNNLNGTFELSGTHQIKFSPIATTKMACPPDGNNKEQRMLKALFEANNYYFRDGNLTLLHGSSAVAKFRPESALQQK